MLLSTRHFTAHLRYALLSALLLATFACGGCTSLEYRLNNPGPLPYQRLEAVRFDPYPNNQIAPEIVGGRPLDFQVDRAEGGRARLVREGFFGFPL